MDSFIVEGSHDVQMKGHPYSNEKFKTFYPHQIAFFHNFGNNILMKAGTASGKTLAAVLPIVSKELNAIFVYPTNALIYDQREAIEDICNYANKSYSVRIVNSDELDSIQEKKRVGRHDAVISAFQPDLIRRENRIILTNPDIIFWLLKGAYRRGESALRMRKNFDCIVFDEIHAYKGKEYANILFEIRFVNQFFNQTIYMLSATTRPGFEEVLRKNVGMDFVEIPETGRAYGKSYDVEVFLYPREKRDLTEQISGIIRESDDDFEKTVVIVNSVLDAEILSRQLEKDYEVSEWHGLCSHEHRSLDGEIVVGTNAIELGIDFSCDRLIFESASYESFIQRFGRAGRHTEGSAIIILPSLYSERIRNSIDTDSISRASFEDVVYNFFGRNRVEACFFGSKFSAAEHKTIMKWFGFEEEEIRKFITELHCIEERQWQEIEKTERLLKEAQFLGGKSGFRMGGKNALIHIENKDELLLYDFFWCLRHESPQWQRTPLEVESKKMKRKIKRISKYGGIVAQYRIPYLEKNYNRFIRPEDGNDYEIIESNEDICLYYGTVFLSNGIRRYKYEDIICATTRILRENEVGSIQNCFESGGVKIIFGDEALYVYSALAGENSSSP